MRNEFASCYDRKDYKSASIIGKSILQLTETSFPSDAQRKAVALNDLGAVCTEQGNYEEAEKYYLKSLEISKTGLKPDSPQIFITLDNLARLYSGKGDFKKAEEVFRMLAEFMERKSGPDGPNLSIELKRLALACLQQGKSEEAESLLLRALAIRQKNKLYDLNTTTILRNLSLLYNAQHRLTEAEYCMERAVSLSERYQGVGSPEIAPMLIELARIYNADRKYDSAERQYSRALLILKNSAGPNDPKVGATLNELSLIYYHQGVSTEYSSLSSMAMAKLEKDLSKQDSDSPVSHFFKSPAFSRYEKAESLSRKALAINEKAFGPDHPRVVSNLDNLAKIYEFQGRTNEAGAVYGRLLVIFRKINNPETRLTAVLEDMRTFYQKTGNIAGFQEVDKYLMETKSPSSDNSSGGAL